MMMVMVLLGLFIFFFLLFGLVFGSLEEMGLFGWWRIWHFGYSPGVRSCEGGFGYEGFWGGFMSVSGCRY